MIGYPRAPFGIKISDFVHCQKVTDNKLSNINPTDENIQTLGFRAPEVIIGLPYSYPIDMWSVGVVACYLYYRKPLFSGVNNYEMVRKS